MEWEEALERAQYLHGRYPVADAHFDLPLELFYRRKRGERGILLNRYCPVWKNAGVNLVIAAVFLEDEVLPELALRRTLEQIAVLKEEIRASGDRTFLVTTASELNEAVGEKGRTGILLHLEGLEGLNGISTDGHAGLLSLLQELGVRGASLTWSRKNQFATGCCRAGEQVDVPGCITREGWKILDRMTELGMYLDISHLNETGMEEILAVRNLIPIATHSNARAVYESYRNLTDEQLCRLGEKGGLAGFTQNRYITGGDTLMMPHLKRMIEKAGERHVCLGIDFGDSLNQVMQRGMRRVDDRAGGEDGVEGHGGMMKLTAGMLQAGICEDTAVRVLGSNLIEFFLDVI